MAAPSPARKRTRDGEHKAFWLDKMPALVCEKIAAHVSDGNQLSDDGLCLAQASQLQRQAVLASIPYDLCLDLDVYCISHGWVDLLVGHIRSLSIRRYLCPFTFRRDDDRGSFISPLLRLIRKVRVERASMPGIEIFLRAARRSESIRHLGITGGFSHSALVHNLKYMGPPLVSLELSCDEKYFAEFDMSSPRCPIEGFHEQGWTDLTTSCPNLKHLHICCRHMQPSTAALLVGRLPSLAIMGIGSPGQYETLDVSEEDIVALCGLENVSLENVSGGMQLASRVGKTLTNLVYTHRDEDMLDHEFDLAQELVKCPRLSSLNVKLSRAELETLDTVVPLLPKLRRLTVVLEWGMFFEEIRGTVMKAIKILHVLDHPQAQINLKCTVSRLEMGGGDERMAGICSFAASQGGNVTYTERSEDDFNADEYKTVMDCKVILVEK